MPTVLIVSNSLQDVENLCELLRQMKYLPIVLSDYTEIEILTKSFLPDILFLDTSSSDNDVLEIYLRVKKNLITHDIPIVLLGSQDNSIGQDWSKILGLKAYLFKPIDKDELSAVLQQIASR